MVQTLKNIEALKRGWGPAVMDHFVVEVSSLEEGQTATALVAQGHAHYSALRSQMSADTAKAVAMHTTTQALVVKKGDAILDATEVVGAKVDAGNAVLLEKLDEVLKRLD